MHIQRPDSMIIKSAEALQFVTGAAFLMVCVNSISPIYISPYAVGIGNRVMLIFLDIAIEQFNVHRNSLSEIAIAGILVPVAVLAASALDLKIQKICLVAIIIFDFCCVSQFNRRNNNR